MALEVDDGIGFSCYLKWIHWNSGKIPIIMQSRNGPCPLIATLNVLLLREKVKLPSMLEQITADQLLTYLGECIMDFLPPPSTTTTNTTTTTDKQPEQQQEPTTPHAIVQIQEQLQSLQRQSPVTEEGAIMNLEQHIHDAMEILPKLKTGLDVNMRFMSITDFEYTPECIIFDLLRIPLYHGWIIDPSLTELYLAIGSQSYNQLMDSLVANKNSQHEGEDSETTEMVMIESFLEQTASQLTQYGLEELRNKIKDNELGILFRNNHFLTLFKRDGRLYTLVTDHGYLTEDSVVWEILDSVEGAGRFFDSNFQESQMSSNARAIEQKIIAAEKQVMDDLMMALSLEEEERAAAGQSTVIEGPGGRLQPTTHDDMELAKKLQAEWDSQYAESLWPATTEQQQAPNSSASPNVQYNPSRTRDLQNVFKPEQMEESTGAPANELHHEPSSSANETAVDAARTSSEPSPQIVVVASPSVAFQAQVGSEQTATLAASHPADSTTSSSAITPTTTTPSATTSLSTASTASRADFSTATTNTTTTTTTTTIGRASSTGRGLRSNSSETKNSKESNCSVS